VQSAANVSAPQHPTQRQSALKADSPPGNPVSPGVNRPSALSCDPDPLGWIKPVDWARTFTNEQPQKAKW
jgi:hypothetical protein